MKQLCYSIANGIWGSAQFGMRLETQLSTLAGERMLSVYVGEQ